MRHSDIMHRRSILHDLEKYSEPLEFEPERFLKDGVIDPSVQDPNSAAFGFGRRFVISVATSNENR